MGLVLYTVKRRICGPEIVVVARHLTYAQASALVTAYGARCWAEAEVTA